jgi:hypothetical protein
MLPEYEISLPDIMQQSLHIVTIVVFTRKNIFSRPTIPILEMHFVFTLCYFYMSGQNLCSDGT